jgi:hypothetical protein
MGRPKNSHRNLVLLETSEKGVWTYPVLGLEQALAAAGVRPLSHQASEFYRFLARVMAKAGMVRNFWKAGKDIYLAILMGAAEYRLLPFSYGREVVVYCFDCWPAKYPRWEAFFRRNRIRLAFFSARRSAEHFSQTIPGMKSVWLPEAVNPEAYLNSKSLQERPIDVLELGRKDDAFHQAITPRLQERHRVHLYEQEKGRIIFPAREALVKGLGDSKISVCFPSSMTHPARSGDVETVTHRYFEAMASGCLILGKCPQELSDLFGYNPMIEADEHDPYGQIDEILQNLTKYQELVSRNYRRLTEVGTWKVRAASMIKLINNCDFTSSHEAPCGKNEKHHIGTLD